MGSAPSLLSIVIDTSARPRGARPEVPAKMTSSIFPPRRLLAPCSPITQASASTTLDLPEPLGPTMQVMPGSRRKVVDEANDLNPLRVRLLTYTGGRLLFSSGRWLRSRCPRGPGTPGRLARPGDPAAAGPHRSVKPVRPSRGAC